jgi:hypothetical protein
MLNRGDGMTLAQREGKSVKLRGMSATFAAVGFARHEESLSETTKAMGLLSDATVRTSLHSYH